MRKASPCDLKTCRTGPAAGIDTQLSGRGQKITNEQELLGSFLKVPAAVAEGISNK